MNAQQLRLTSGASQHASHLDSGNSPVSAFRGIAIGLWLTSAVVVVLSLVPGIDIALGNLPGDIEAGTQDASVRLPFTSFALIVVTLTGLYFRILSHLTRH